MEYCKHDWISNSGEGGKALFENMPVGAAIKMAMEVKCAKCEVKVVLTDKQWRGREDHRKPRKMRGLN